jgi:hypothetical protein
MPFDWALYLQTAKTLASQAGDEAALRSAVSRAYCAAFGVAATRMKVEGKNVPASGEAHQEIWKYFESAGDMYRRQIGQNGKRLRYRRNQADYEANTTISDSIVTESLRNAEKLVGLVGKLK